MGGHAECLVECGGSGVALPDVQGYVVAAFIQGKKTLQKLIQDTHNGKLQPGWSDFGRNA